LRFELNTYQKGKFIKDKGLKNSIIFIKKEVYYGCKKKSFKFQKKKFKKKLRRIILLFFFFSFKKLII